MNEALSAIGAVTIFVDDLAAAKAFYAAVFQRPLIHDGADSAVFAFDHVLINLLQSSQAPELVAPARVGGRDAGARLQFSVWVEDVDAVCRTLQATGVELINGPMDRDWGKRTACFADPDGTIWEVAQDIAADGPADGTAPDRAADA